MWVVCVHSLLLTGFLGLNRRIGPAESGKPEQLVCLTNVISTTRYHSQSRGPYRAHTHDSILSSLAKARPGMAVVSEQVKLCPASAAGVAAIMVISTKRARNTLAALVTFRCNWDKSSAVRPGTPVLDDPDGDTTTCRCFSGPSSMG